MLKHLLIMLVFCLPLQQVQPSTGGFNPPTNVQKVQFGAKLFETLAGLWADSVDMHDSEFAKKAVIAKFLSRIAGALEKGLYPSYTRDEISKGLNGNVAAWQCLKDIEEFTTLKALAKKHGDTIPDEVLKKHYSERGTWKEKVRPFVRFASLAVSTYSCLSAKRRSRRYPAVIAQAVVDLLLRYVSSDGDFKALGIIQAGEVVSLTAAAGYDILSAANGYSSIPEGSNEKLSLEHRCQDCGREYKNFAKGGVVYVNRTDKCDHHTCKDCAKGQHIEACSACERLKEAVPICDACTDRWNKTDSYGVKWVESTNSDCNKCLKNKNETICNVCKGLKNDKGFVPYAHKKDCSVCGKKSCLYKVEMLEVELAEEVKKKIEEVENSIGEETCTICYTHEACKLKCGHELCVGCIKRFKNGCPFVVKFEGRSIKLKGEKQCGNTPELVDDIEEKKEEEIEIEEKPRKKKT